MTPQELEQWVVLAADATNPSQQQHANTRLYRWISLASADEIVNVFLHNIRSTDNEVVLFYALTTFLQVNTTTTQRQLLRTEIWNQLVAGTPDNNIFPKQCWNPAYLRTKVGVLLAKMVQLDFPSSWPLAFQDLQDVQFLQRAPDIFLRTLQALMDDFGYNENDVNTTIKDIIRGLKGPITGESKITTNVQIQQTISAQLVQTLQSLLAHSLAVTTESTILEERLQLCVLSLTVLRGFCSWVDLSLIFNEELLQLVVLSLARGSTEDSPAASAAVVAMEYFQEFMARGMEEDKKIAMLVHTQLLSKIHAHVNLETVDASPIEVVLEVAKFINRTGLELMPTLAENQSTDNNIKSQLLELFFRCFAYDDIDVSGGVIPLAGAIANIPQLQSILLGQLLSTTVRQMRYPQDFQYDYEDEDEAEEEMYRTELRKLNTKLIRVAPNECLQFICQSLAQLPMPLSTAPTPDMEVSLRLVYHYCEGIRPPPGMKVVMRNESFCNLLIALHQSDISMHPHREVITLYYETAVRYHPLLKKQPELLQKVLESISGNRGLQHEHPRVRSRSCYLLSRLVKSVGGETLRPYVDTAVSGIRNLLERSEAVQLRADDALYLFETMGLLLGKTGLDPMMQQRYLTEVATPYARSMQTMLTEQSQALANDPQQYGMVLSESIAAISSLSKGFSNPPPQVQHVLQETVGIVLAVVQTLPVSDHIRNKTFVFLQRMIQCLDPNMILHYLSQFLPLLIDHCNSNDILDFAQLLNQMCKKYKIDAVPSIDLSLLPFLAKCQTLALVAGQDDNNNEGGNGMTPPHLRVEQLSIQKLSYTVLQHIVSNNVTSVLISPTNGNSLEQVLRTLSEGAFQVEDPTVRKTCILFFRELLQVWIGNSSVNNDNNADKEAGNNGARQTNVDNNYSNSSNSSNNNKSIGMNGDSVSTSRNQTQSTTTTTSPTFSWYSQGLVRFVIEIFIPGIFQSFCVKTFNQHDAMQWRTVSEFASLLVVFIKNDMYDMYLQALNGPLTSTTTTTTPESLVYAFRQVKNEKEMENCLREWITIHKQEQ